MSNVKTVKVGVMPGRIQEVVVEVGTTVASVLEHAGLDSAGYEIKVDGVVATTSTQVTESTNLILLAKQVKGNVEKTIKVGVMPGRITELVVDSNQSFREVLALAELDSSGYEVKADGTKVENLDASVGGTNLILLAKQVKGNSRTVKIGVMPGRITELAVEPSTTFAEAIALAELDSNGYEVKADGTKVEDLNAPVGSTNLILLAKQVKGNSRTVKIGVMPGRITELAVEDSTTFAEAIALAELDSAGYEVKADGTKVDDLNAPVGSTNLILLAKQVKGNIGSLSFGLGMKSARVGDQIDAEVTALKGVVSNAKLTLQQFDFVESQLQQLAQLAGQADPMLAMQFQQLQQQINNIQAQAVNGYVQVENGLVKIDGLTDKIQN